jgi:hypothetical protein
MLSVKTTLKRLVHRFLYPEEPTIRVKRLRDSFKPTPATSLKALLTLMNQIADTALPTGGSIHPYFRRRKPDPQDLSNYSSWGYYIDLKDVPVAYKVHGPRWLNYCISKFDARAAKAILSSAKPAAIRCYQSKASQGPSAIVDVNSQFLEQKSFPNLPPFYQTLPAVLAMMAYADFFPNDRSTLKNAIPAGPISAGIPQVALGYEGERIGAYMRDLVNAGLLGASPGYCGTIGPAVTDSLSYLANSSSEGNYDMAQTYLVGLAYSYFDELTEQAREHLITVLLAGGKIRRVNKSDITTSGPLPNDWNLAGTIPVKELAGAVVTLLALLAGFGAPVIAAVDAAIAILAGDYSVGETENHIISMLSTRYLTNQLLYQRTLSPSYDNRRNAVNAGPTCFSRVLSELRNILRCDFSEYNAKSYQEETHWPLLNLATYAYDHEVRLAARMALDYVSAHIAVSSNNLRRIVPFRRRNEDHNVSQTRDGRMSVGLIDAQLGADPLAAYYAIQAGNIRVYVDPNNLTAHEQLDNDTNNFPVRPQKRSIADSGGGVAQEVHSCYRLPPLVQDLFVNDMHRRFFQRLHRTPQHDEVEGARNCENYELYASSPSYLITAGGEPSRYAIDPTIVKLPILGTIYLPNQDQQIGVAMPTTFMPTGQTDGFMATDLIQFSHFSDKFNLDGKPEYKNYGVAPDFACGHDPYFPDWVKSKLNPPLPAAPADAPGWHFGHYGSDRYGAAEFYLAIYVDGDFGLLEAYDVWLHPKPAPFDQFCQQVLKNSITLRAQDSSGKVKAEQSGHYVTFSGTQIDFKIWNDGGSDSKAGALTSNIVYSQADPAVAADGMGDAGNNTKPFLNGTILNSPRDAVIEVTNPFFGAPGTKVVLDQYDPDHPRRTSETGEVEQAGYNNEVWVNFGWKGGLEGDFYHPFNSVAAAIGNVADGGVIKIVPGWTSERARLGGKKRCKLVAPLGGVRIGVR